MRQKEMAVKKTAKTRTHFAYRIGIWSKPNADSLVEHVASVEDYDVAIATFHRPTNAGLTPHHAAAGRASNRGQPPPAPCDHTPAAAPPPSPGPARYLVA
jgi:hypothetical protein